MSMPGAMAVTVAEVTPEWLTTLLRQRELLPSATRVERVRAEDINSGAGMAGSIAQLSIEYDGDRGAAPHSLIAKCSATEPSLRTTLGRVAGFYGREVCFYMEFAARTRVMTPLCYHAAFDEVTLDSLILLEDLGNEDMGAGDETFSFDEGVISLTTLARMHAAFWNAEELTSLAWLFREDVPALPLLQLVEARYPTFLERFGKRVPVALAPTLGRLAAGSVPTFRSPLTLCHGDFHRNNVCIRGDGTPIFFDWQLVSRGPAALDVQRFFMAALRAPGGIEQIAALQDVYCRALRDAGVSGYPREMLERDCRAAAVLRLSRAVGIGGDPAALDENRNATVERILSETGVLLAGTEPEALFA